MAKLMQQMVSRNTHMHFTIARYSQGIIDFCCYPTALFIQLIQEAPIH